MLYENLSPYDKWLLSIVDKVERRTGRPARTVAIATELNKPVRTVCWHLSKLKRAGALECPTPKGGWMRAGTLQALAA